MAVFGRLDIYYPDGHLEQSALAGELISVGLAPRNTLVLDSDAIAPYQFQLRYEQGRVFLINLDAVDGTRVAGILLRDSQPLELHEVTDIEIGDLRLVYYPGSDQPTLPMGAVADRTQPLRLDFHLRLERPLVEVFPSSSASVELTIANRRPVETRFEITFSGLPEGWGKLNQAVARIAEGESDLVSLHIVPPRRAATPPADYPVTITVNPINEPIRTVQQLLTVRLREFVGLSVAVDPPLINNGEKFQIFLLNQGNEALPLRLLANSPHKDLAIELSEREIQLSAGQRSKISGSVRAKRPFSGKLQSIPIALLGARAKRQRLSRRPSSQGNRKTSCLTAPSHCICCADCSVFACRSSDHIAPASTQYQFFRLIPVTSGPRDTSGIELAGKRRATICSRSGPCLRG